MPSPSLGADVRRRLLWAGFPPKYANGVARELDEHWNEIAEESLRNGMNEADAHKEADARLGTAGALAKDFVARAQNASLLNRFPTLTFGLLALLLTVLWWVTLGSVAAAFSGVFGDTTAHPPNLALLDVWFDWIRTTSYVLIPLACCLLAELSFAGWRPALWACLVIAAHNASHMLHVASNGPGHGTVSWAYGFDFGRMPSLLAIAVPLAVFGIYRAWRLRESDAHRNETLRPC